METGTQLCPWLKEHVGWERGHLPKADRSPDPPGTTRDHRELEPSTAINTPRPRGPHWRSGGQRQWALEEPPGPSQPLKSLGASLGTGGPSEGPPGAGGLQAGPRGQAPGGIPRPPRSPGRRLPASTSVGPGTHGPAWKWLPSPPAPSWTGTGRAPLAQGRGHFPHQEVSLIPSNPSRLAPSRLPRRWRVSSASLPHLGRVPLGAEKLSGSGTQVEALHLCSEVSLASGISRPHQERCLCPQP